MIRYMVVDDEYMAHEVIKKYCAMLPDMQWVKSCNDALEALEFLRNNTVDLIFLDLNMPQLKGFDFLKTLTNQPKIIVTTAYKEYALEGYELDIVDYLLKPFSFERLLKAINKAFKADSGASIPKDKAPADAAERIFIKSNKKYLQLVVEEVLFVEASGNYVQITTEHETIKLREKLSDVLVMLPENKFLQVHKSFAVSIAQIKSIVGNRIILGQHEIPIGNMYRASVLDLVK